MTIEQDAKKKDWMAEDMEHAADRANAAEHRPDWEKIASVVKAARALGPELTETSARMLIAKGATGIPMDRPELRKELEQEILELLRPPAGVS